MNNTHILFARDLGIDTYRENIIFLRADSPVCRSEGFTALTRVAVRKDGEEILATLNVVHGEWLAEGDAGLSREAMRRLGVLNGEAVTVSHPDPVDSMQFIRAKLFGKELSAEQINAVIHDVAHGKFSNVELAAFIAASTSDRLSEREITHLTKAMAAEGNALHWGTTAVYDKHCVGGLPGNRTSPILVSIVAAAGLMIPKTSSRAITSPAGTADTMQVITNVDLTLEKMRAVVERENACLAWGGAVGLSRADDILISVERALDIDSRGQMIASVMSKKVAAGSTHIVIDIPVGATAKVRTSDDAIQLKTLFEHIAKELHLEVDVLLTDGSQPIGRGIGPALEAIDVLAVLRREENRPHDLEAKSIFLAGRILEMSGKYLKDSGASAANEILSSGRAWEKFQAICEAQGRFTEPSVAPLRTTITAHHAGVVAAMDNRRLAHIAKLAGAPNAARAGVRVNVALNKHVAAGEELFSVFAETAGELNYALAYLHSQPDSIRIEHE